MFLAHACRQGGQVDHDSCAPARFTVDLDVSPRLLDDAVDLAEAQARSLSGLFGREKRFKHPLENVLRHSRAGVADGNSHVWPWNKLVVLSAILLVKEGIFGRDRQLPARGHGITRVHREIEDGSLELHWIRFRQPQPVRSDDVEGDRLAQRAAQEIGGPVDEFVDVEGLWIGWLLSRK